MTSPRLTDTHAHLNDPQFEHDLDQVLERARAAGATAVLVPEGAGIPGET